VHLGHQAVISTSTEHAKAPTERPSGHVDPHPEKILRKSRAHLLTASPHKIALIGSLAWRIF